MCQRAGAGLLAVICLAATAGVTAGEPISPGQAAAPALIELPFVPQTVSLCGGAALAMVMRYWGAADVTAEEFAPYIDQKTAGIPTSALDHAAVERGWRTVVLSPAALQEQIDNGRPVIALIEVARGAYHYVVVVGVTSDRVVVHDPARSPYRVMSRTEFDEASRKADRWMLMVLPAADRARPSAPATCPALVQAAIDAAGAGRTDEAAARLQAAAALCPADPAVWRERAGLAFLAKDYRGAAELASKSLALDPRDEYTQTLLATSRYLAGEPVSALKAWHGLKVSRIDVTGATLTPQALILERIGVAAGGPLSAGGLARAEHRVNDLPSLDTGRIRFSPDNKGAADLSIAVVDRPRAPTQLIPLAATASRAIFAQEVPLTFASLIGAGDRITALWRFQHHRQHVDATLAVPGPRLLPGIVELNAMWERQTFAGAGAAVTETRRRGGVALSDWATGWLKWRAGVALDRFADTQFASADGAVDVRGFDDRVSLGASAGGWWRAARPADFARMQLTAAMRTSASSLSPRVLIYATAAGVSAQAPLSAWPAADGNSSREGSLRAHPLIADGVVTGHAFGRTLAALTVTYEHPLRATTLAAVSAAAFVDAARAWRTLDGQVAGLVDAGVGLRIKTGSAGTMRLDFAAGLTDGRVRLSAGFSPAWPR